MTTATKRRKTRTDGGSSTTIPYAELKRALATVAPAVPSRAPRPVLTNVRIGDGLCVATDLELRIETPLAWDGEPILLPHSRLVQIVNAAGTVDDVEITVEQSRATIRAGRGTWTLPTEDAAEFPGRAGGTSKPMVHMPADQFVALADAVRFATDDESSRYALGAVLVKWSSGTLTLVGTDGRRMAVAEAEFDQATDDREKLPPRRAIDVVTRLAGGADVVQLEHTETEFVAEIDGTRIYSTLIEGKFPRWQEVEPSRNVVPTRVTVGQLLAACRQAAICATEESKGVTFAFTADGIGLSAKSAEAGESHVTCDVVESGKNAVVKLDPTFVTDWLDCGSFDAEEAISVEAVDGQSAVVFRAGDCRCVIMPLADV